MSHLPALISDLALILISAGVITLLFKWLKQPLVLGYIVAGLLAGPYIRVFPTVVDVENINLWAEMGVVFLLFALGLEFSFKKLINVGSTAFITAITEVVTMLIVGYLVGHVLGWSTMNSIFLGGMLSMSSTTIIIKAFDDLGLRSRKFTGIVFGTLVVEDLVAIIMMVLLSTMAVSRSFAGEEMVESVLKVAFFLVLWFLVGIFVIPALLKKVKRLMNDETLLVIALGLCLGMVVVATKTGFSAALGAFVMGSILAETVEAERIEHIIKPVKDLFGAIFFVSVGMLVDPAVLVQYAFPVLLITLVTIIGKATFSSFGVLLSGQPLKTSIQSGFSLAQIGEFAFIIAALGVSLKVLDEFVYPIIVAVSVITTFTTPYFIRLSDGFAEWLYGVLPEGVLDFLDRYSSTTKTINHESDWQKLLKQYVGKILIHSVLLTAILLLSTRVIHPFMLERFPEMGAWGSVVMSTLTLLLMVPFLSGLVANRYNSPQQFMRLWKADKYNHGRLVALVLFRVFVAILFVAVVLIKYHEMQYSFGVIIAVGVLALIVLFRRDLNQYDKLEAHFLTNLNRREEADRRRNPLKTSFNKQLSDKDIHLAAVTVSPHSPYVGKSLAELPLRADYGVSIVEIVRGDYKIYIPKGTDRLYPQDKVVVVGTDEQLRAFQAKVEAMANVPDSGHQPEEITVNSFVVDDDFPFLGQSIRQSNIGRRYGCLIVGLERGGEPLATPDNETVFEKDDLVWVVGDKTKIKSLISGKP